MKAAFLFLVFCIAYVSAQSPVNVTELGFKGSYSFNATAGTTVLFVITYNNETFGNNFLNAYAEPDSGVTNTTLDQVAFSISTDITQSQTPSGNWQTIHLLGNGSSAVICQNYSVGYPTVTAGFVFVELALPAASGNQTFDIDVQIDVFETCSVDNFGGSNAWIWIVVIVAIVLVIVVIIAAVAGFLYWKKKQAGGNYDLYNDS